MLAFEIASGRNPVQVHAQLLHNPPMGKLASMYTPPPNDP
jgi:hypothetical protein